MRFVQFTTPEDPTIRAGVRLNDDIIPIGAPGGSSTILDLLKEGGEQGAVNAAKKDNNSRIPLSSVSLKAPILNPDKVICVGMNYKDHCEEQNVPVPVEPIIFSKFSSSIVGPSDPIIYPEVTQELDFEVELAVVIGKKGKNISAGSALDYVFGYTVAHDVSARDWQLRKNGGQWLLGKTMDAFCPLGPEIVTKDEIPDPHALRIKCTLNDETVQDSSTSQIVHKVEAVIAWCSRFFTLLPGDVILTGTPPGVGVFRKPPIFLKVGDVVECSIEKIGSIRNKIVAEN